MMYFYTLASSSAGNAALLCSGSTRLLIDAGISYTRIRRSLGELGLPVDGLDAILITHAHADHTAGLATLIKRHQVPIYCSEETGRLLCEQLSGAAPLLVPFSLGTQFRVESCRITSIPTSHDCPGSTGFRIERKQLCGYCFRA